MISSEWKWLRLISIFSLDPTIRGLQTKKKLKKMNQSRNQARPTGIYICPQRRTAAQNHRNIPHFPNTTTFGNRNLLTRPSNQRADLSNRRRPYCGQSSESSRTPPFHRHLPTPRRRKWYIPNLRSRNKESKNLVSGTALGLAWSVGKFGGNSQK